MKTLLAWILAWSLIYVQWRFGMTLNRFFVVIFLVAMMVSGYFFIWLAGSKLVTLKSKKLLIKPLEYYRRRLLISLAITTFAFYGFYRTQVPGQIEAYQAMLEETFGYYIDEETKRKARSGEEIVRYNTEELKQYVKKIPENWDFDESNFDSEEMLQEITAGWNMAVADIELDSMNWEKATDLVKKYPSFILNSSGRRINAAKALENPQEYYGKVIKFSGKIYSIEQLPPDDSVAQFFDGNCYHAMIVVNDNNKPVMISAHIVGNAANVKEDSDFSTKGYIYGQARLSNSAGNEIPGLAFVGFKE